MPSPDLYSKKTHIIFINDWFLLGGIEVLELKVARHLAQLGHKVTIVCREGSAINVADSNFHIVRHKNLSDFCNNHRDLFDSDKRNILASFHPSSALCSLILAEKHQKNLPDPLSLFHWVSHSRAFFFSHNFIALNIFKKTFFELPSKSVFFMNNAARDAHSLQWHIDLCEYPVLKIIGREPSIKKNDYKVSEKIRVVSVGRLAPFKSYNKHSPRIIRALVDLGLNIEWDIWGYGSDHQYIVEEAEKLGVKNLVRLRGALDHSLFDMTVMCYDIFVGMGTAALEAAKLAVPTILAIDNGGDRGYGFLSSVPGDTVGDRVAGLAEENITETLFRFSKLSEIERKSLGDECSHAACERESDLNTFATTIVEKSTFRNYSITDKVWLSVFRTYLKFNYMRELKRTHRQIGVS